MVIDYTIILIQLFWLVLGLGAMFVVLFFFIRYRDKRSAKKTFASKSSPDAKVE